MSKGDPVVFIRDENSGSGQRAYNRVQLEDADAVLFSNANPLPIEIVNPTTEDPLPTDDIIGALATIDSVHYETHEGELFSVGYIVPHASPVADNGTIDIAITTGARYCHAVSQGTFGGDFEGYLYEGATITGGTPLTVYNHKRVGGEATTVTAVHSPTVNNVGTGPIDGGFIPGGTGGQFSQGGGQQQRAEWILAPNTIYLYRLTNRAGSAQQGSLGVTWYEETNN